MAVRTLNERKARSLTNARVRHAKPGKHYDLNGLFLLVESGGSRRWVQRIVIQRKRRDLGLGSYPLVSLAEAREAAADNRKVARAGGDPTARASDSIVPTFAEAADKVIEMHTPGWKNGGKTAIRRQPPAPNHGQVSRIRARPPSRAPVHVGLPDCDLLCPGASGASSCPVPCRRRRGN